VHSRGHRWAPESYNDGLLEVLTVAGSMQLAQIQLGIASAEKLCQAKKLQIRMLRRVNGMDSIPLQIDGIL
jgi:hypothetical protein